MAQPTMRHVSPWRSAAVMTATPKMLKTRPMPCVKKFANSSACDRCEVEFVVGPLIGFPFGVHIETTGTSMSRRHYLLRVKVRVFQRLRRFFAAGFWSVPSFAFTGGEMR